MLKVQQWIDKGSAQGCAALLALVNRSAKNHIGGLQPCGIYPLRIVETKKYLIIANVIYPVPKYI